MLNKIKEFFTGKKPESKFAHPLDAVTTPNVSAPYKVEPPAATTPIPSVPEAAPAVVAAPAKAPRKPRAPKVAPVAAVKEKAPAKAKAPKAPAKSKKV
jgi:hypothetical protein